LFAVIAGLDAGWFQSVSRVDSVAQRRIQSEVYSKGTRRVGPTSRPPSEKIGHSRIKPTPAGKRFHHIRK
jgi:hypothetical protein